MTPHYFPAWVPGGTYHVFNRAVALNRLFCSWANVRKFRESLAGRLRPVFALYSVSLVGNHFHLHGRVRSLECIETYVRSLRRPLGRQRRYLAGELSVSALVGDAFGRAFQAYARSFNLSQRRTGALLDQTVRRLRVRDDLLSRRLCVYHHANAMKHGLYDGYRDLGALTSYAETVRGDRGLIDVDAVYARFGGRAGFVAFHERSVAYHARHYRAHDELRHFGYTPYYDKFAGMDGAGSDGVVIAAMDRAGGKGLAAPGLVDRDYALVRGEPYVWVPEEDDLW